MESADTNPNPRTAGEAAADASMLPSDETAAVTSPVAHTDQPSPSEPGTLQAARRSDKGENESSQPPAPKKISKKILVIDIGGTKFKLLSTGQTEPLKFPTGKDFSPAQLVETTQ